MHDLITQIEQAAAGSVTEHIRLIKQRRKSLDHVIKFTLGISRLQKSLESVLLLKKPTADIPRDLLKVLENISDNVANLPSKELEKRLTRIEESIQEDMNAIMGITKQPDSIDGTNSNQPEAVSAKLQTLIDNFRRRINTAIVLKLHMRTRGMKVAETTIPITAEELVSQVSKLVVEEKKCRTKTKDELKSMNNQMELILNNDDCPQAMKSYADKLRQEINQNIEHLNKGRDIEKMPYVVEIIQMGENETTKSNPVEQPIQTNENLSTKEEITETPDNQKLSFFSKLIKWLTSSWSVKWKDIK